MFLFRSVRDVAQPGSVSRLRRDDRNKRMIIVYVLYSLKLSKYYVGCTGRSEKRLEQHNNGRNKFTSNGIPWDLVHTFPCENRAIAMQLELKIKKRGIRRYLSEN